MAKEKQEVGECKLFGSKKCFKCEYLSECKKEYSKLKNNFLFQRMPHFMEEQIMKLKSAGALKLLLYLNKRAQFNIDSENYGQWTDTYENIAKAINVSEVSLKKMRTELVNAGLVKHHSNHIQNGNTHSSYHRFTLCWMEDFKKVLKKVS
ncbi:MAG: hypothetical protein ABIL58_00690 [Pseudomonadota bacterium]